MAPVTNPIVISVGDPAGVGPIVSARALLQLRDVRAVVVGDATQLSETWGRSGIESIPVVDLQAADVHSRLAGRSRLVVDIGRFSGPTAIASAEGGAYQLETLRVAHSIARDVRFGALVTGPISKAAIHLAGKEFTGQTEWLAVQEGLAPDAVTMMFLGPRLAVALVTTHLAVRRVPDEVTPMRVARTAVHLAEALLSRRSRSAEQPIRIVVAGLNPHAGESGKFGTEEQTAIEPGVALAESREPFASGRAVLASLLPAETAIRMTAEGRYDGVVVMMHDQATIPAKALDWHASVNVTWGLPFLRTSVDHGVAYDARRDGNVDARGMIAAIEVAQSLTRA